MYLICLLDQPQAALAHSDCLPFGCVGVLDGMLDLVRPPPPKEYKYKVSTEEEEEFLAMWNVWDQDNSGTLDQGEFHQVRHSRALNLLYQCCPLATWQRRAPLVVGGVPPVPLVFPDLRYITH